MTVPFLAWCTFCKAQLDEDTHVTIGFKESPSGPGWPWYACCPCVTAYRVIPFAEHPSDTDGSLRYRARQPFAPRSR